MSTDLHLSYIKQHLIGEIVTKLPTNEKFESYTAEHSSGLDGFMSALYNIRLLTKVEGSESIKERQLIAKFMKGDVAFREQSKSYVQFANEVYIYATVLPEYAKVLEAAKVNAPSVDQWVPASYVAKFGYVDGLSDAPKTRESVLVLDNLKPLGYQLGPRLYLTQQQLLSMCKPLGQYHALSYALKLQDAPLLDRLKSKIVPLLFINDDDPDDVKNNFYRVLYRVAFDRFFDYFERQVDSNSFDKKCEDDLKLLERVRHLKAKYYAEPTRLLERIRTQVEEIEEDRRFGVILHGDYNRNNVLFRFQKNDNGDEKSGDVKDMKMIDFQELRYGTPAMDLSFFMYMNSPEAERALIWQDMLKAYHSSMHETLKSILQGTGTLDPSQIEEKLEDYNFEKFNAHFGRNAFYGVMICLHFLPWMLCAEEDCERMSTLFETDMHGEEFRRISIEAGGDEVNKHVLAVVRHACKMGYMDHI